jgi:hypothetical protein
MPKDWSHVEEAIEVMNWAPSFCMMDGLSMEKQSFKIIVLPGWIFHISSVIHRHYFNSFGNFRVFSIQIY